MKKIKLLQDKQVLVLFVTILSFFDSFLACFFFKFLQLKHVSSFILDQQLVFKFQKVHIYLQLTR